MSSLNAFEAPPRSSRVPTRLLPRTLYVPGGQQPAATTSGKVQQVLRLAPRIPAPTPARPSSPRTGMLTMVAPPPTPVATKGRRRSGGLPGRVLAALLLMALAAGGVFVYQRLRPNGPPHPSAWDPRVTPLVRFAERERGLRFEHPVFVDFLTDSEYTRAVAAADSGADTRAADRRDLANAFGFAPAYDAASSETVLAADSTRGTYSPSTGRIMLRATELTPGARVVLVHELVHALQAQHFDLHLGGPDDLALRSVAEGDANRIANAYLASLATDEQATATAENALGTSEAEALARVPWPMVAFRYAPYWLGPTLVNAAAATNGNAGVDELFRHVPTDTELIGPWRRPRPTADAPAPAAVMPADSTVVQPVATLSVMQALVMLDAWLPWQVARGAVDHWVAGSYVVYRLSGGLLCMAATATFDAAPTSFAGALSAWATATGSTAAPVAEGRTVRFTACDRGSAAASPPPPVLGPSTELLLENAAVAANGTTDPATIAGTLCVERTLIDNPGVAPLLALPTPAADQQAFIDLSRVAARQTCGA